MAKAIEYELKIDTKEAERRINRMTSNVKALEKRMLRIESRAKKLQKVR